MESIVEPTADFDFQGLSLGQPSVIPGGAYFTRILFHGKPLYFESPKCLTRQGMVKSGKKVHADLMYDHTDTAFVQWIENLETKCQQLLFEKGDTWFQTKLEMDDIESAFTSSLKVFKSGRFYLMRVHVNPNMRVFDEVRQVLTLESVTKDTHLVSIVEVQGIRFSSRNFQIDMEVKQSMVVSPDPFLDDCYIRLPPKPRVATSSREKPAVEKREDTNEKKEEVMVYKITQTNVSNEPNEPNETIETNETIEPNESTHGNTSEKIEPNETKIVVDTKDESIQHKEEGLEKGLEEVVELELLGEDEPALTLKPPEEEVYYEMYKAAKKKAKEAKKQAIVAFLEAKNIKKTYLLDDLSEDEEDDTESEMGSLSEY